MISIDTFIKNLGLLWEYELVENIEDYYRISNKDINKIILSSGINFSIHSSKLYNNLYYYMVEGRSYIQIYVYKIDDDYYKVNIYVYKNGKGLNDNRYKLDQIGGLLKFLKILFRE